MKRFVLIFLIMTAQVFAGLDSKSGKVINVATPTVSTDAANKQYVDDTTAAAGHNILSVAHGDTVNTGVPTRGSMFIANATPLWAEVVIGAAGTIWRSDGTDPSWSATTNITALGTVVTGVWNATAIDISDYTNLTVSAPITLTDDDVGITVLKDIVAGVGLSGGENDVLPGGDADTTLTFDPTELSALIWSAGGSGSIVWQWNLSAGDPTMTFGNDFISLNGDLKILGDDLFMTTNTNRFVLMGDGTNYNPEAIDLATDTVGDFVNSITGGTGIASTGATSGENISHTLSTTDSEIVHDNLSGFVADEHIDWTSGSPGASIDTGIFDVKANLVAPSSAAVDKTLGEGGNPWTTAFIGTMQIEGGSITDSGDLKIQPDAQGDVSFFSDADVADGSSGKSVIVHRKAAEFDSTLTFILNSDGRSNITANRDMLINTTGGQITFIATGDLSFNSGDDITMDLGGTTVNQIFAVRDSGNNTLWKVDGTANMALLGKMRIGDLIAPTNTLEVNGVSEFLGDTFWVGAGSGLPFGECHQTDGSTFTVTMTTQNVYVEVDAATTNISATELNLVTFPDDHYLLCTKAGRHFVTYSFTGTINSVAGGVQHVESAFMVNGTQVANKAIGHNEYSATGRERNFQGHTILDLNANDHVSLGIVNTVSGGKILTIDHLNITVGQIGGT